MTLESVQKFYEAIEEEPKKATLISKSLLDVCNEIGFRELNIQPVITLTREENGKTCGHAVVVKSYDRSEDYLDLTTIDSLPGASETLVECPIFDGEDGQVLGIGGLSEQWCLASEVCYYVQLN